MEQKPIPAFYCCYLLRSIKSKSSLYIGSTPNPLRRLKQHNGDAKGGAVRTSKGKLQPWEMTCLVSGFPSQIAALQFEWAWQNPHITRRIPSDQRITKVPEPDPKPPEENPESLIKKKRRSRKPRPRMSLGTILKNLQLLLRVQSFARWPLELRFFSEDVLHQWKKRAVQADEQIRDGIPVSLDLKHNVVQPNPEKPDRLDDNTVGRQAKGKATSKVGEGGLAGLSVTYGALKEPVEKGLSLLQKGKDVNCGICHTFIDQDPNTALVCPEKRCAMLSHLACLSRTFLFKERNERAILPIDGECPGCHAQQKWVDLVKARSLRIRGKREVGKLTKKPRERKTKAAKGKKKQGLESSTNDDQELDEHDSNDDDDKELAETEDGTDEHSGLQARDMADVPWEDDERYYYQDDDDNISLISATSEGSIVSTTRSPTRLSRPQGTRLEIVIEDSDREDAVVLD